MTGLPYNRSVPQVRPVIYRVLSKEQNILQLQFGKLLLIAAKNQPGLTYGTDRVAVYNRSVPKVRPVIHRALTKKQISFQLQFGKLLATAAISQPGLTGGTDRGSRL